MEAEESDGCAIVNEALGAVSDMFEKYTGKFNVTIRFEVNQKRLFWEQLDLSIQGLKSKDFLRILMKLLLLTATGNWPGTETFQGPVHTYHT